MQIENDVKHNPAESCEQNANYNRKRLEKKLQPLAVLLCTFTREVHDISKFKIF